MSALFHRRSFLSFGSAAVLSTLAPLPVLADEASAKRLVDVLVGDINKAIAARSSDAALYASFERIFTRYADVPTIARYALGADARRASAAEMRAFTEAFQGYISRKYGKRFRQFIGGTITVQSARRVKSFYEVRTIANLRGEAPFDVTFLVSDQSGRDKFFNMFIEGVNLLLTERTEIGAMLDRRGGDMARMTADLRKAG